MRHKKSGRRLGRNSAHRKAMFRNMVTSLMEHGRIQTTEAKAKELRRIADRIITLGKRVPPSTLEGMSGEDLAKARARRLHNIRRASSYLRNQKAVALVFNEYSERFKDRPGGYTRIVKTGFRPGDNAPMAVIELVGDMPSGAGADETLTDANDTVAGEFVEEGDAAETPVEAPDAEPEAVEDEATE